MNIVPKNYHNKLSLIETQKAIKLIKDRFEKKLADNLNLIRVSAPLFVRPETGLNDNLTGNEKPVSFSLSKLGFNVEIVQSLAKWKRNALGKYGFSKGEGLYTDMNAIRPDEETDNLHSIYVDQWDWEKVIDEKERNLDYLKDVVRTIVRTLSEVNTYIKTFYPILDFEVEDNVYFITGEELLKKYPNLSPKDREHEICKIKKTVFIIGIGHDLSNGKPHDIRSPDYDDWSLNGDILIWSPLLNSAVEITSMGIRVDDKTLKQQLKKANMQTKENLPFHQNVINKKLPLTIGGGIGQSRICQLLLEKIHIGEVQTSVWCEEDIETFKNIGAYIL